jgi:hypothetical protein
MSIYLGNTQFDQVEERLGYKLTEDDKIIWDEFHSNNADLAEKDSCFHVFDIPTCIVFKGEAAKQAIIKIFTPDKIVKTIGQFMVYEQPAK